MRCCVSLLDTVIMQLEERFAPITSKAMGLLYLLLEKIASHTLADLKSKLSEFRVLSVFTSKSFTLLDRTCTIQEQPGDER